MDFIAIDFETANANYAPCSVGWVVVTDNQVTGDFYALINPEQPFAVYNTAINKITPGETLNAPTFPEIYVLLKHHLTTLPVVAQNAYVEKSVIEKSVRRYGLNLGPVEYYDTMRLFKHNYPEADRYDLKSACAALGVELVNHHNALDDAAAAAMVMLAMMFDDKNAIFPCVTGDWIDGRKYISINRNDPSDPDYIGSVFSHYAAAQTDTDAVDEIRFDGSTFVITGDLVRYSRDELANMIRERGGRVTNTVSGRTDYVIAGLQNLKVVKDQECARSNKLIKAEAIRNGGGKVKIIDGDFFLEAI